MSDSGWPQGNPLAPAQAIAFMTAVGREVVPEHSDFAHGGELLGDAAAEDPFEAVLTTCAIATTASRMVRELDPQRDWDREVMLASDLPAAQRHNGIALNLLHVIAKLNGGVNADPAPLLARAVDPLAVAETGARLTAGFVRLFATTRAVPIEAALADLFGAVLDVRE